MTRRILLISLALLCSLAAPAQEDLRQKYETFTLSATRTYAGFKDSANLVFSNALKQNWERFNLNEGKSRSVSPLPDSVLLQEVDSSFSLPVCDTVRNLPCRWKVASTSSASSSAGGNDTRVVSMSLYEAPLAIRVPSAYGTFHPQGIDEKSVAAFWKRLSSYDYGVIVSEAVRSREYYGLNDWAVFQWVQALSEVLFPSDIFSERTVFGVFMLNQMGLKAKIARSSGELLCLFPSLQNIYSRKYVVIDGDSYYLVGNYAPGADIYTYRASLKAADNLFDMRVSEPFLIGEKERVRQVVRPSTVFGEEIRVSVNGSATEYFEAYPQLDPVYYATARCSNAFESSLKRQITDLAAAESSDREKLEKILSFVQNDFEYGDDAEVIGRELPLFPEQDFLYECSDCEDRTALLNFLVRNVLGFGTLVLEYPDHVALAVELPSEIKGDYVRFEGRKFYMCDPSYIGARVGMTMPRYRNVPAKIWVTD